MSFRVFRGRKIDSERLIRLPCGAKRAGGQLETVPAVGDVLARSAILLTVSCCLRQPRIASGATRFISAVRGSGRFL